jgi:hypothetical protein
MSPSLISRIGVSRLPGFLCAGVFCCLAHPAFATADIICSNVAGNLINNCGFETGDFSGWTQGGNTSFTEVTGSLTVGGGGTTFDPNSGNFQAELGPSGSDGTLAQQFATTVGNVYQVSFYMAGEGGEGSDFSALFNGTTLLATGDPAPQQFYTLYSFNVTATTSLSTLQFAFRNDSSFQLLDDVSVKSLSGPLVPEPGTYALLFFGLAGLGAMSRRK